MEHVALRVRTVEVEVARSEQEQTAGILRESRQTARDWAADRFGWSAPIVREVLYVRGTVAAFRIEDGQGPGA